MNHLSTLTSSPAAVSRQYPWVIVGAGLLILIVINGLTTSSLSVFDEIIQKDFGLSRSGLKSRETITYAVSALFILASGVLIDRVGVKKLLLSGLALMTLALAGYGFAQSLWHLYLIHVLLGLAYVSAGSVAVVILVSAWFQKRRGLALGITLAGTSLGSAIFPPILTYLSHTVGWRETFHWLAIIPLMLLVATALVVKSSPTPAEAYGSPPAGTSAITQGKSFAEALRMPLFWLIACCGFLTFLGIVGLVSNLFLHLRGLGFHAGQAAWTLSLYFFLALLGKFIISSISDYYPVYRLFTGCLIGLMAGAFGLAESSFVLPAVAVAALSWGGVFTLYNILIVRSFGLKAAGKINGTINLFENCGSLLGPLFVGWLSEKSGSYEQPLYILAGIFAMAAVCSVFFLRFAKPADH